ncbi:Hsp20/alpha crystallin family protein [Kitasatospora sp. NPDC048545]|uniref:Hsp20/alpha crystallin family protein n=1 Tax=Kitasatospora sp. NPDC048545 TaxID=3157208 RepID=UPI003402B267
MLTDDSRSTVQRPVRITAGQTLSVTRHAPDVLPGTGRIVSATAREPYEGDQVWIFLTAAEAPHPAGMLLRRPAGFEHPHASRPGRIEIDPAGGNLSASGIPSHTLALQRSEFRYGAFTRSVRLPAGVRDEDVTASYDQGVLTVRAPVGEATKPARKIEINRGS